MSCDTSQNRGFYNFKTMATMTIQSVVIPRKIEASTTVCCTCIATSTKVVIPRKIEASTTDMVDGLRALKQVVIPRKIEASTTRTSWKSHSTNEL